MSVLKTPLDEARERLFKARNAAALARMSGTMTPAIAKEKERALTAFEKAEKREYGR